MMEATHDYELVDRVINQVNPASGGAYTTVGTYDHSELVALVVNYAEITRQPVEEVLRLFGHHLFGVFLNNYPDFFNPALDAFGFLRSIDNYIHIEVAKLYPEARLPRFTTTDKGKGCLEMIYISERKMAALAQGLIEKTMEHYGEQAEISMQMINSDGSKVKFTIVKS